MGVGGLSLAGAAVIMLYKGNVYAVCRAIPFWNSSLLPVLYVAYALRGGTALLLLFLPSTALLTHPRPRAGGPPPGGGPPPTSSP